MAGHLHIYLPFYRPDTGAGLCVWMHQDQSNTSGGSGNFDECCIQWADLKPSITRLIIPGELVTRTIVELPTRSASTALQALPFLLDEQLAGNPERTHFVLGKIPKQSNETFVSAVDLSLIEKLLRLFEQLPFALDQLITDSSLLTANEALQLGERVLLANSEAKTLVVSESVFRTPPPQLEQLPDISEWRDNLYQFDINEKYPLPDVQAAESDLHEDKNIEPSLYRFIVRNSLQENLLQGRFQPKSATSHTGQLLLHSAIALSACFVLVISYLFFMGWQFSQKADALDNQARASYRELFPQDRRIFNIRKQMSGHINRSSAPAQDGRFLDALAYFSRQLEPAVGHELRQIRYQAETGALQIELEAASLESLNQLQTQLSSNPTYQTEILSANSNSQGVVARLKMETKSNIGKSER